MHYGRLVYDQIAQINFGLRPNFGLKIWSKRQVWSVRFKK